MKVDISGCETKNGQNHHGDSVALDKNQQSRIDDYNYPRLRRKNLMYRCGLDDTQLG